MRDFLALLVWENPGAAWLFVVPGLVLVLFFLYLGFRRRMLAAIPAKGLFRRMAPGVSGFRLAVYWLGMVVVMSLFVVALMRPRYGLKDVAVPGAGVDVAVVVDVSRSMLAKDVVPDRLRGAIVQVDRLLDQMKGDRVTLVPFAGLAYIQTPLTVDYEVIRQYLAALKVTDMPVPGTAIGRALNTARRALGLGRKHRVGKYKGSLNKAVVMFTDGENFEGDPVAVAKKLAREHVKVFTVGVGTPSGKPVPRLDKSGKVVGVQREKDGKTPVISKLNEKLLKNIANITGGEYFSLSGGGDVSKQIYKRLQELEKIEYVHRVRSLLEDRFQYPLGLAVLLLLMLLVMPLRKRGVAVAMLLISLVAGRAEAQGFLQKQQPDVARAARLYAQGKYGDALKTIEQAQKKLPPSPWLAYDKGLIQAKNRKFDDAIKSFEFAISHLQKQDPKALSKFYYAKGTTLIKQAQAMQKKKKDREEVLKRYRAAVDALTRALQYDPGNKAARYNLEVAAIGGYPPCKSMEDGQEPNNSRDEARFIKLNPKTGQARMMLYLCPNDPDFFKLPMNAGETLMVNTQAKKKKGFTPDFRIEGARKEGPSQQAMLTMQKDGTVFIHVLPKGVPEDGAPYKLSVQVVPPCPQGDDKFEDNDSLDTAKPLKQGKHMLRICPNDPDYFSINVPKGQGQDVSVLVPKGQGPLSVTLYDAQANVQPPKHVSNEQGEAFIFHIKKQKAAAQKFLLDVHGQDGDQGFYQVQVGKGKGKNQQKQNKNNRNKNKNKKNKRKNNKNRNKKQKKQKKKQNKQQDRQAVEQLMKQLDKNPENIQAKDALKRFKVRNYMPQKDW